MTRRLLLALLLLALAAPALAQTNPIPADRRTDWTYAGVPGGIPTYPTCTTLGVAGQAPTYAQTVTGTTINQAIVDCGANNPNGSVVVLNPGTYTLAQGVYLGTSKVVLRGAGADQTILKHDPANEYLVTLGGGESLTSIARSITGGGAKDEFTITVADTTDLTVGKIIVLVRDNTSFIYWHNEITTQKFIQQNNIITNVNGSTITVRNPWTYDFSTGNPFIGGYWNNYKTGIGLENLKVDNSDYTTLGTTKLSFSHCYGCWIKGVDIYKGQNHAILVTSALNSEIRDSFIHESQTYGSNNSGIGLYPTLWLPGASGGGISHFKIENNIFRENFPAIENFGPMCGNVYGYNYITMPEPGPGSVWVTWAANDGHSTHPMMNLWEGNITPQMGSDGYWGSSSHGTFFRNLVTGATWTLPLENGIAVNGPVWLKRYSYYYNLVGNVFGSTEVAPTRYEETVCSFTGGVGSAPYQLGYPNIGNNDCPPWDDQYPTGQTTYPDTQVKATLFRWGNYDFYYDAVRWDAGELGGVTQPADHTMPNSYYLTSKPSWFGSVAWPPIGPDVTATTHGGVGTSDASDHANKIPAQLCWETRNLLNYGSFNAAACYAGAAALPNAPSNVRIR